MIRALPRSVTVPALALAIAFAPGLVRAEGPAFDCSKAEGTVEKLICADAGLSGLDRKLHEVYEAALAKSRDDVPRVLRAEQRGWIKGRDECWKAEGAGGPVYLTASWTAANVHDCVEGQYQLRISELQATMHLVPEKGPVFFACEDNPANEIVATFFDTDPKTARLERGDRTVTAWLVPTASGARYEGPNVEFWNKGKDAMVTWEGAEMTCATK